MKTLINILLITIVFSCKDKVPDMSIAENNFLNYFTFKTPDTHSQITLNVATSNKVKELILQYKDQDIKLKPRGFKYVPGLHVFRHTFTNLDPSIINSYSLKVDQKQSRAYKFKTIDRNKKEVRYIVGGDTGTGPNFEKLTQIAATYSPEVAVIGGDIAYANGDVKNWKKWVKWLSIWRDNAVTPEGVQIPLILAIGNHETKKKVIFNKKRRAPFFFSLFDQGKKAYYYRQVGKDNLFVILDTGHVTRFTTQRLWLKKKRKHFRKFETKNVFYHVGLYPAHRNYKEIDHWLGRKLWEDQFNKIGIQIAYEHHDHVLKRTHKIRNGKLSDRGVIYIGDGAMGTTPREARPKWYLHKHEATSHFWLADIKEGGTHLRAIGLNSQVADDTFIKN